MRKILLYIISCLLFVNPSLADPVYTFTFEGEPLQVSIVSVEGSPGFPAQGDLLNYRGWSMVLGPPGRYSFSAGERPGLYLSVNDGPKLRVWTAVTDEDNPLTAMTPAELSDLRGVLIDHWRPELAHQLSDLELSRCSLTLKDYADYKTMVAMETVPPLPKGMKYLNIDEGSSIGYTDLSGLGKLPELRYLGLKLMTMESFDAGVLEGCEELRVFELRRARLTVPKKLSLTRLRVLRAVLDEKVDDLDWAADMPSLEILDVAGSSGLTSLAGLANLNALKVVKADQCPIIELPTTHLPALSSLSVLGAPLPEDEREAFVASNPDTLRFSWTDELRASLGKADRVLVRTGGTCHTDREQEQTLFETAEVDALLGGIEINDSESGFECMCCGEPSLEFFQGEQLIGTVGFHHGQSLRWSQGWPNDGMLTKESSKFLVDWLSTNGVDGPKIQIEQSRLREERFLASWEAASSHLPESVKAAFRETSAYPTPGGEQAPSPLMVALKEAYPDTQDQALALFGVVGTAGPWNPSNMPESIAEEQLETFPLEVQKQAILAGLADDNVRKQRGAARLWSRHRELRGWQPSEEAAVQVLEVMTKSPSAWTRQYAIQWLTQLDPGAGPAADYLTHALADPDPMVRRAAICASSRQEAMAQPLLSVLEKRMPEPRQAYDAPDEDYSESIGGNATDADLAALALGLMNCTPAQNSISALPASASRDVAMALLGQPEHLNPKHFQQPDRNLELQMAAVEAVVRCRGAYGLSWALDYKMAIYGNEPDIVASKIAEMLREQKAPGSETIGEATDLADLKGWYAQYGADYLRSIQDAR